jgi:hypothetical protein
VTPGHVRFTFRVEAEEYFDGLTFYVDGKVGMSRVSNQREFVSFSINITTPGIHSFEWVFSKDISISVGDDQAQIRVCALLSAKKCHDLAPFILSSIQTKPKLFCSFFFMNSTSNKYLCIFLRRKEMREPKNQ